MKASHGIRNPRRLAGIGKGECSASTARFQRNGTKCVELGVNLELKDCILVGRGAGGHRPVAKINEVNRSQEIQPLPGLQKIGKG